MPITGTSPYTQSAQSTAQPSSGQSGVAGLGGQLNEDTFLKLLVAQLRNQDPMAPTDNAQMMAQMAQFSMVDQLNTLNETTAYLAGAQGMLVGSGLLGKEVTATPADGSMVVGTVQQVALSGGDVILTVDGQDVLLSDVIRVGQPGTSAAGTQLPAGTDAASMQAPAGTAAGLDQTNNGQATGEDTHSQDGMQSQPSGG